MMDMNKKIRDIQRQAMAMSTINWQDSQEEAGIKNDPMSLAFDEVLKKTTVSIDPGLELPPEVKQVITQIMNGSITMPMTDLVKGLEEWLHHMASSPTIKRNPFNQLTASTSYKMLAMALIHLVKHQQSHQALDVLTRLCNEKKIPVDDAVWTFDQVKGLQQSIKQTAAKWQGEEQKASLNAFSRLTPPSQALYPG